VKKSALRRIRALAVEIHEDWIEAHRCQSKRTVGDDAPVLAGNKLPSLPQWKA
jgi:hypothetical protein